MRQEEIVQGSLFYHAVHGLCRVTQLIKQKQSGKEVLYYSLEPKAANKMKARFIIAAADMEISSGFHALVSLKEANKILEYLRAGDRTDVPSGMEPQTVSSAVQENQMWVSAREILAFSQDNSEAKDQRKRQKLERLVKGLVGELAIVFKVTLKETVARVRKSLGSASKINPGVLVALAHAGED